MIHNIKEKLQEVEPLLINIRRYLHQNPELSGLEYNTSKYVNSILKNAGINSEIIGTEAGPAVIANIGNNPHYETIAFRADMDALPVMDKKNKIYRSKNDGIAHACGHDFNITTIIGTALILAGLKNNLDKNFKFIFQPAEEISKGGAQALIKTGIMNNVNSIWAVHAIPTLPAGQIGINEGIITAAIDNFKIRINGQGGHSARPQETVDSIYITNQILNCLYSEIGRSFDSTDPVTLSIGKISGGTAPNIISECCIIEGTVRTLNKEIRSKFPELINSKISGIAQINNATADIQWEYGPPSVFNDHTLAMLSEKIGILLLGKENILKIEKPSMGAEDFSRYLDYAPGMLIRIGTGGEGCFYPLHSGDFDVNESALSIAVNLLASIAIDKQNNKVCLNKEPNILAT